MRLSISTFPRLTYKFYLWGHHRNYILIFEAAARILGIDRNTFDKIHLIVTREIHLLNDKKDIFWGETPYKPPKK